MKLYKKKSTLRKAFIAIMMVTLLLGALEYYLGVDNRVNLDENNEGLINHYEQEYQTFISGYRMLSNTYYNEIINTDEVTAIISEANVADEAVRDELRNELYTLLEDTYSNMEDLNFRQLHFVLADNTSFLRFHMPEKFGDDLTDIRQTVKICNEEQIYIEGFEEGRVFNGYRFEYPLAYEGEHVGCVEASISCIAVASLMDQAFEIPTTFLIKKSVVDDKVWDDLLEENYEISRITDDYYCDIACSDYIANTGKYIDLIDSIYENEKAVEEIIENMETEESFAVNIDLEDHKYTIVFIKVENVLGEPVGYLEFYNQDKTAEILLRNIAYKSGFVVLIWLILVIAIIMAFRFREQLESITYLDKLTGTFNRYKLYDYIDEEIERHKRYKTNFSIILYDIDNFKEINDRNGHVAGDNVLIETVQRVQRRIRAVDKLFRFGGDEFIILLPNTNLEEALSVAEDIRKMIESVKKPGEINEVITFSLGVAEYKEDWNASTLINKADEMLYLAKEKGRNRTEGK